MEKLKRLWFCLRSSKKPKIGWYKHSNGLWYTKPEKYTHEKLTRLIETNMEMTLAEKLLVRK